MAGTELKLAIYPPLHIVQLICEIVNAVIGGNDGMDGFIRISAIFEWSHCWGFNFVNFGWAFWLAQS